jgi:rod shape-determining protein MreD
LNTIISGNFPMRLFLLFFLVGIFLILMQTTLLHLLPLGPVIPDLTLVLCVYLGLYHPTVGAALGSFLIGYSVDIVSSPSRIVGLNAFALSLVFLLVYVGSRTIWLQNPLVSSLVVLFAALVKGAALVLISAIFVSLEGFWIDAAWYIIREALLAAVLAPIVFALLRRGENYVARFRAAAQ